MTCQELLDLRENYQFEVKSAQGINGNGEVPKDVWESYSAMANSEGGLILLGAKELKDGSLEFLGIKEIDKIQKEFWTTINNNQKVNLNILSPTDVEVLVCENKNLLLISKDDLFQGGKSDCRNRVLQKMFQYIGMGEQAGSGYPKILRAWIEQHWQYPDIQEDRLYETTTLFMPTISLFPEDIQMQLSQKYQDSYNTLDKDARLALILAYVEKNVTNARLSSVAALHPADATKILRKLVENGLLIPDGVGRGTTYSLNDEFNLQQKNEMLQQIENSLQHLDESLQHLEIVKKVRNSKKAPKDSVVKAILEVCTNRYLTATEVATLLNRDVSSLRNHYLSQMVKDGLLELKFKEINHKNQAYIQKREGYDR